MRPNTKAIANLELSPASAPDDEHASIMMRSAAGEQDYTGASAGIAQQLSAGRSGQHYGVPKR